MTKVYLLSDGDYSDYRIIAVFSTKVALEKFKEQYGCAYSSAACEEYELDPEVPQEIQNGLLMWHVQMWENGDVYKAWEYTSHGRTLDTDDDSTITPNRFTSSFYKDRKLPEKQYRFNMWAKDKEHAIKIANERRTVKIALGGT